MTLTTEYLMFLQANPDAEIVIKYDGRRYSCQIRRPILTAIDKDLDDALVELGNQIVDEGLVP